MLNEWGLQQEGGGGPIGPGPQPLPQPLPPGWGVPVQPLPPGWGQPVNPTPPGRVSHLLVLAPVLATSTPDLATASTAPAAPSASVVPAIVGVLGGGAVGGIFGYIVRGTTGAVVGALVGAAAGGFAGSYVGQPAAPAPGTVTEVLPPGKYTKLTPTAHLQAGHSYLLSTSLPAGTDLSSLQDSAATTRTEAQQQAAASTGEVITILGLWFGTAPAGWPSGDPNAASGVFMAVQVTTPPSTPVGANNVWTVGGATS